MIASTKFSHNKIAVKNKINTKIQLKATFITIHKNHYGQQISSKRSKITLSN